MIFGVSATRHAGTLSRAEIYNYIRSLDARTRAGVIRGLVILTFLYCAARVKELHVLKAKHVQIRKDNCVYIFFEDRKNHSVLFVCCCRRVFEEKIDEWMRMEGRG